jgi:hypothetical protein
MDKEIRSFICPVVLKEAILEEAVKNDRSWSAEVRKLLVAGLESRFIIEQFEIPENFEEGDQ